MPESDNITPHTASDYDATVRRTIPSYETIHRETIDLVRAAKPNVTRWLDTGCGTGHLIEMALPFFPQTRFVLADPSDAMLRQSRERLLGKGETGVSFLPPIGSEGLKACVDGERYQVVTAIQCHHYLSTERRELAVRACYDILEEGGLFICFENVTYTTEIGTQIAIERWARWQKNAGRSSLEVQEHIKRFNTKYFPITVRQHLTLLDTVGFRTVELFWFSQMQAGFFAIKDKD